ncbi:MAG: flagellar basal-body MS-ring/collar protein FliF [Campylobacterota bacterium]|nr:flagellar basal-body MS-ring/collar protein FliF [Campylobacterota bacterium]
MDFKALIEQLSVLFTKLSKMQKIIVGVTIAGIVAFLVFLVVYTSSGSRKSDYKVLFENLSAIDSAKVIEQLEKDNIPYKIPRENVITVPKDVVYKERMTIASLGIAKESGVGFELFDEQEFGATRFDQNIKFLRALEGELARTIDALAPIERSSVNLALPKESLFVSKEVLPSASVMVKLIENRRLTVKQIRGIKNLVAASVPKLSIENVTLVNNEGETLGDNDGHAQMSELSQMQQKYKHTEERKKEQKIVAVLSPFIGGKERVVATVTIEYDFSQESYNSETFDPESVVRSEQSNEEKREGTNPKEVGGVPGAVSNIGPVEGLKSQQSGEKYEKTNTTTNYEISKKISSSQGEFAITKRITAAVVVDGKYQNKRDEAGNLLDEKEYIALDESQLQSIRSLVTQSIGIDETRGDQISVRNFQFEASRSTLNAPSSASKIQNIIEVYLAPFGELFKYILVILIILIGYKKVIAPFSQRMLEVSAEEDDLEKPVLNIEDDEEEDLVEKVQAMRKKVEDQLGVGEGFSEDELKHDVLLEKLRNLTEERPDEVASILQVLLDEENNSFDMAKAGKEN